MKSLLSLKFYNILYIYYKYFKFILNIYIQNLYFKFL